MTDALHADVLELVGCQGRLSRRIQSMRDAMPVKVNLVGVEETLLIPLWARAAETRRPDAITRDERAVELQGAIDYDFDRFTRLDRDGSQKAAIAIRTELLDRAVRAFLILHPDATVVNLGAGLDTRFHRLDNGQLTWYEVDLPRSMAFRKQLIPESERHRYVEGSVLEAECLNAIAPRPGQPVLIVAEGLFMYLQPHEVRSLVVHLAAKFPGADLLFEAMNPFAILSANLATRRRGLLGIKTSFGWGLWSGRELEEWVPGLRWLEEWYYFDHHPERWGAIMTLLRLNPIIRTMLRIEHIRFPS